jgi:hypothetical protein
MDVITLIAEIVKAVAWPAAALAIALLLRNPVLGLIEGLRLSRVKYGDWEAQFEQAKREVQQKLLSAAPQFVAPALPARVASHDETSSSPTAAILSAWDELEAMVATLASKAGITGSLSTMLQELVKRGLVKQGTVDSVEGLRQMRNLAVHAPRGEAPQARAREFVTMVEAIRWTIQQEASKSTPTAVP